MKFTKEQLEGLYKKGHISEASYAKLCKGGAVQKMADGGEVMSKPSADQVADATAPQTGIDLLKGLAGTSNKSETDAPTAEPGIWDQFKGKLSTLQDNIGKVNAAKSAGQDVAKLQFKDGNVVPAATAEGPQVGGPTPPLASDAQKPDQQGQMADLSRKLMGEGMSGQDRAFGMQEDAIRAGTAAGQKQAAAEAGYLGEQANQLKQAAAIAHVKGDLQESAENEALQKYNDVNEKFMKMTVDPEHFHKSWQDKSTGSKIMMGIGLALMGRAAPDFVNSLVNRDIDAQKANMANFKQGVDHTYNAYQMLRNKGLDARQAEMGARAIGMDAVAMQIKATMAKYQNPMIQANGANQLAGIEHQKAQTKLQLASNIANSPAMMYKDGQLASIARIPDPGLRKQAMDELTTQDKLSASLKEVDHTYDVLTDLQKSGSRLLNPVASHQMIDRYNLVIDSLAKELFNKVSDSEIDLLKNQHVDYATTPEAINASREVIKGILRKSNPTPVLTRMGLGSKSLDLKPL